MQSGQKSALYHLDLMACTAGLAKRSQAVNVHSDGGDWKQQIALEVVHQSHTRLASKVDQEHSHGASDAAIAVTVRIGPNGRGRVRLWCLRDRC